MRVDARSDIFQDKHIKMSDNLKMYFCHINCESEGDFKVTKGMATYYTQPRSKRMSLSMRILWAILPSIVAEKEKDDLFTIELSDSFNLYNRIN